MTSLPERRHPASKEFSAGGVVFRKDKENTEILLIEPSYPDRRGIWTFPKGWVGDKRSETQEETTVREVREEGGVEAEIVADLGEIHYFFTWEGKKVYKTVHFYLMRYISGSPGDHDFEVAEARWFSLTEAESRLTQKTDQDVLGRARRALDSLK